jgi:hypothetical protein
MRGEPREQLLYAVDRLEVHIARLYGLVGALGLMWFVLACVVAR